MREVFSLKVNLSVSKLMFPVSVLGVGLSPNFDQALPDTVYIWTHITSTQWLVLKFLWESHGKGKATRKGNNKSSYLRGGRGKDWDFGVRRTTQERS